MLSTLGAGYPWERFNVGRRFFREQLGQRSTGRLLNDTIQTVSTESM